MQFSQVVGLKDIKKHLTQMVLDNKIPHAQLFLNQEGAGGLPMALAFAQYLVCEQKSDTDSCGECSSCQKAQKLIHPDIHMTYPVIKKDTKPPISSDFIKEWRNQVISNPYINEYEWLQSISKEIKLGNITREEASQIINTLYLKSFEGGYKIQIVWMAENLGEVGNTLLKIFEEPPEKTIIILIAENLEAILPTVISRTQIVKINAIDEKDIIEALVNHHHLDSQLAEEYAYIANGNYRKAQQLVANELETFGDDLKEWMIYCMRGPSTDLIKWTENKHTKSREYLKKFFEYTIHIFRESLSSKYTDNSLAPHVSKSEIPVVQALKKYISHNNLYQLIPLIEEAAYFIERNAFTKMVLLNLSIQIRKILK
ncbi:MAG: hypothetical protein M9888_04540 [Chitinophagales bacterium]|nr:hypothetical protein [Chitinophagales bacterium]